MKENRSRRRRLVITLSLIVFAGTFAVWHWNRTESKVGRLLDEFRQVDEMTKGEDQTNLHRLVKAIVAVGPEAPFYVLKQLTNPPASWSAHVWLFNKAGAVGIELPAPPREPDHQAAPTDAIQLMGNNAVALAPALGAIALATNLDLGARQNALFCLGALGTNGAAGLIAVFKRREASELWLSAAIAFQKILRTTPELADPVFQFYEATPRSDWDTRRRYFGCLMWMMADPSRTTRVIREALSNHEDQMFRSAVSYAAEYFKPPDPKVNRPDWSEAEQRILPEAKRACVAELQKLSLTLKENRRVLDALKELDMEAWQKTVDQLVQAAASKADKR